MTCDECAALERRVASLEAARQANAERLGDYHKAMDGLEFVRDLRHEPVVTPSVVLSAYHRYCSALGTIHLNVLLDRAQFDAVCDDLLSSGYEGFSPKKRGSSVLWCSDRVRLSVGS